MSSLAPALLLSMPQLIEPIFARSVVLLCEHASEGAFGLIVNRPSVERPFRLDRIQGPGRVNSYRLVQGEAPASANGRPTFNGKPAEADSA